MKKSIKLTIENKEYTVEFNLHAMSMLEEETGVEIANLSEKKLESKLKSFKFLESFFYCGLNTHHPNLKKRDAGILISLGEMNQIMDQVLQAFYQAFPEEEPENADKKKGDSNGMNSGQ